MLVKSDVCAGEDYHQKFYEQISINLQSLIDSLNSDVMASDKKSSDQDARLLRLIESESHIYLRKVADVIVSLPLVVEGNSVLSVQNVRLMRKIFGSDRFVASLWALALDSWYIDKRIGCMLANLVYLIRPELPGVTSQLSFFVDQESISRKVNCIKRLTNNLDYHNLMNSSVVKHNNLLYVFVRGVSYSIRDNGSYQLGPNNDITSSLHLFILNKKTLDVLDSRKVRDDNTSITSVVMRGCTKFGGLFEDARFSDAVISIIPSISIFRFIASKVTQTGVEQWLFSLRTVVRDNKIFDAVVIGGNKLEYDRSRNCEKNWIPLPIPHDDKIMYQVSPACILKYKFDNKLEDLESTRPVIVDKIHDTELYKQTTDDPIISYPIYNANITHSGGSNYVRLSQSLLGKYGFVVSDYGYLTVVHDYTARDNRRLYMNRFLITDKSFRIIGHSSLFKLYENVYVEYLMSIVKLGSDLVMSVGIEDRECQLVKITLEHVLGFVVSAEHICEDTISRYFKFMYERLSMSNERTIINRRSTRNR